MKKRIGIMGGTFNPIHNGHVQMAIQTYQQFQLDEVLVMPSGDPPHKRSQVVLDAGKRSDMVKLAIKGHPGLVFSDLEITRSGYSYTAETLQELKDLYEEIYFIIGADSLFSIEKWYHPEIIMKLCTLVVANRDRHPDAEFEKFIHYLTDKYQADIRILHVPDMPVSSSQIRENVVNGQSISDLVSPAVAAYIEANSLYK